MLNFIERKFLHTFLLFAWLAVTSPPLLFVLWLVHDHEERRSFLAWIGLPLLLAWMPVSWWLAVTTAHHMCEENQMFLAAVKNTLIDLRLRLAFVPLVGYWFRFKPDEDKTQHDDDVG